MPAFSSVKVSSSQSFVTCNKNKMQKFSGKHKNSFWFVSNVLHIESYLNPSFVGKTEGLRLFLKYHLSGLLWGWKWNYQ